MVEAENLRSFSACMKPQPLSWTHIGWDWTLQVKEVNERVNVQVCRRPRCSPGAREVGRDGPDHPPQPRLRSRLGLRLNQPKFKGNFSNSKLQTQHGTSRGYTNQTSSKPGTFYNASHSTSRVFQALTLRLATPSVKSSSPRSINFVILPMAIVLPMQA